MSGHFTVEWRTREFQGFTLFHPKLTFHVTVDNDQRWTDVRVEKGKTSEIRPRNSIPSPTEGT